MNEEMERQIIFYGAERCRDCRTSKAVLDRNRVVFSYRDIETDSTARVEFDAIVGDGPRSIPRILFRSGEDILETLIEPTPAQLTVSLTTHGYIK